MELSSLIPNIVERIKKADFKSEAAVSQGILLPILKSLGWPVFDTTIVIPEYSLEGKRVDYALCHPKNIPLIFIEVKNIGSSDGADKQLFEYAFHIGVPFAVLMDGQEWSFYLPAGLGFYAERRVYKIDFLEREPDVIIERLQRYLQYDHVCSGKALKDAKDDYDNVTKQRELQKTLPKAWQILLEEQNPTLLELLSDKVEDLCGYRPEIEDCEHFISNLSSHNTQISSYYPTTQNPKPITDHFLKPKTFPENNQPSIQLGNNTFNYRTAKEVLIKSMQLFHENDPQFINKFIQRKHGKTRRYIAKDPMDLYPNRPDLKGHSVEFVPGWWLGTNYSKINIQKIINLACEVVHPDISRIFKYTI
ncbi:MAG: hypothetical protein RBU29_04390 [bacterium]|jgi:hypothetical protein|nr:hypothetical protein [bacterium]